MQQPNAAPAASQAPQHAAPQYATVGQPYPSMQMQPVAPVNQYPSLQNGGMVPTTSSTGEVQSAVAVAVVLPQQQTVVLSAAQTISHGNAQLFAILQVLANLLGIILFILEGPFLSTVGTGYELLVTQIGVAVIGFGGFSSGNVLQVKFFAVLSFILSICIGIVIDEVVLFWFFLRFWWTSRSSGPGAVLIRLFGFFVVFFGFIAFSRLYRYAKVLQRDGSPNTSFSAVSVQTTPPPEIMPGTCCFCCNIEIGVKILVFLNILGSAAGIIQTALFARGSSVYAAGTPLIMLVTSYYGYRGVFYRLVSDMTFYTWIYIINVIASLGPLVALAFFAPFVLILVIIPLGLSFYFCYVLTSYSKQLKECGALDTAFQPHELASVSNPWAMW